MSNMNYTGGEPGKKIVFPEDEVPANGTPKKTSSVPVSKQKKDIPKAYRKMLQKDIVQYNSKEFTDNVLHGPDAVAAVELFEKRKLSPLEKSVVHKEGFYPGRYYDHRGVETALTGQTQEYLWGTFEGAFNSKIDQVKKNIPSFSDHPDDVQEVLIDAMYRGDIKSSYKWVKHFNNGKYEEAGIELLKNDEYEGYLENSPDIGVIGRMENISHVLKKYGRQDKLGQLLSRKTDE